jgi:putative lipoprotein
LSCNEPDGTITDPEDVSRGVALSSRTNAAVHVREEIMRAIPTIFALLVLAGCGHGGKGPSGRTLPAITGTVSFTERVVTLPPNAILTVRLVDVSNIHQQPLLIAATTVAPLARPPIPFALEYEKEKIDSVHSYLLEAEIRQGNDVLYLNAEKYPVLTRGKGNDVKLTLASARAPKEEKDPKEVAVEQFKTLQTEIGGMSRVTGERFVGEVGIGWDAFIKEGSIRMVRENLEIEGPERAAARYAYKNDKPWIVVEETTGGKGGTSKILIAWDEQGELVVRDKTRGERSDTASAAEVERLTQQAKDAFAAVSEHRHPKG